MSVEEIPALDTGVVTEAGETVETAEDLAAKLEQLKASATQQYSLKNYDAAAEFYSEAAEAQDQINGEMSLENADLLYQYGRCLYHVAVAKSDVLGGKVAGTDEPKRKKRKVSQATEGATNGEGSSGGLISDALKDGEEKLAEDVVEAIVDEKEGVKKEEDSTSKPYFQITGDENFTDSEDEDDAADAEAEEEEDDFATAFEVLDMARILLSKKLDAYPKFEVDKPPTEQVEQRHLMERLADTHDLQAEISLENERFHEAINDTRNSLDLKLQLYPQESSLIAEAYFKLSLALEFASVTSLSTEGDESGAAEPKPTQVDEEMRAQAAEQMEKAIQSCKLRIEKERAHLKELKASPSAENLTKAADIDKEVKEVSSMVTDMEQRLVDLRNPAVSLSGPTGPAGASTLVGQDEVRGILGDLLGESKEERKKRIEEATENANDLSAFVKQRKKPKVETGAEEKVGEVEAEGKGKRKADDGVGSGGSGKKVKFENGA